MSEPLEQAGSGTILLFDQCDYAVGDKIPQELVNEQYANKLEGTFILDKIEVSKTARKIYRLYFTQWWTRPKATSLTEV